MFGSGTGDISFIDVGSAINSTEKLRLQVSSVFLFNPTLKPPKEFKHDEDRCQSE